MAENRMVTKGMKQTSFCDVAVAVHKSKGAVIHYFPSKKKLTQVSDLDFEVEFIA